MADADTGRQLRQFFVELLLNGNLAAYHSEREAYVLRQVAAGVVSSDTADLILTGSLADIEASIRLVEGGAGFAVPTIVVWPPM